MQNLTFTGTLTCFWCNSPDIHLSKLIGWGPKQGKVFHYKFKCLKCGKKAHLPRNKQNYMIFKDLPYWTKSKHFKRSLASGLTDDWQIVYTVLMMLKSKRMEQKNRNAKIYKLHKIDLFTYDELAKMFHISGARIGQIIGREKLTPWQTLYSLIMLSS